MSSILDTFKFFVTLSSFSITFFTSGLIINLAQCLLYICFKPFNKQLYRKLMCYTIYMIYSQLLSLLWLTDSKVKIYISNEDFEMIRKEHVFVIMNHSYEVDWLFLPTICDHLGLLGNYKSVAKKISSYIPALGWCFHFAEYILLERSFEKDKQIIEKQLNEVFSFPDPVWLLFTPEGTRFTSEKHKLSVEFAKSRGLSELKYHLTPRTRGFLTCLPVIKNKNITLMDVEMAFTKNKDYKPSLMNLLRVRSMDCHIYLRRITSNEIPDDDEKAAQWLHDLFVRKDKLQASFHETGDFFKKTDIAPLDSIDIKPKLLTVSNYIFYNIISLSFWLSISFMAIVNGNIIFLTVVIIFLAVFYVFASYAIGRTEVSKSSSLYGFSSN